MDDLKYNAEHYPDPTACAALRAAFSSSLKMGYRPIVYICSPFSGEIEVNIQKARDYCRFAVDQKYIPIAPHLLYPQFMDDEDEMEREIGLFMGCILITKCAEMWVFGDRVSSGMAREIRRAQREGLPIRRFTTDCVEVLK